jgi:hypothetical protein
MIPHTTKNHTFGTGQTIEAVINLYNMHSLSKETRQELMSLYNSLNGDKPPTLGQSVKVPVITIEFNDDF